MGLEVDLNKRISRKYFAELIKSTDKSPKRLRDKALSAFNDYKSLTRGLFTTSFGFTEIDSIVRELENAERVNEIKSAALRLLKESRKYSPHPNNAEKLLNYF